MKYLEVGKDMEDPDPNVNAVVEMEVEDEETEKAVVRSHDLTQYLSLP